MLITYALNIVDLGSLLPQLPLLCSFAMPQSCLYKVKSCTAHDSHLGQFTVGVLVDLRVMYCVLVKENRWSADTSIPYLSTAFL